MDAHKVAQAKVNANFNAEQKRMITLGNERYEEYLKKDAELKGLIDYNKAATDASKAWLLTTPRSRTLFVPHEQEPSSRHSHACQEIFCALCCYR